MPSFDDEYDRSGGSQDGSSDNDADETMRDIDDGDDQGDDDDGDGDGDGEDDGEDDGEGDGDGDGDGDGGEEDEGDGDGSQGSDNEQNVGDQEEATEGQDPASTAAQVDAMKGLAQIPNLRPGMLSASSYDIIPTIAAPQSTSINAICATADARWVFTGGADGYIRQYNWVDSVNAKLALTVAQRHPFVDSVVKAGVLMTYWENWDVAPGMRRESSVASSQQQVLSPVYSLASQSQGLWLLSGTASGLIRLQSVRHDEGREIMALDQHKSAVSVLTLSSDERSLLSGSWDKTVLDWDLHTGKVRTTFSAAAGQISTIESRPISGLPVPPESGEIVLSTGTFSSNNGAAPVANGTTSNAPSPPPTHQAATPDSLFGGDDADDDDLFGDSGGGIMGGGDGGFGYDEDEMSRAMVNDSQLPDASDQPMIDVPEQLPETQNAVTPPKEATVQPELVDSNGVANTTEEPLANGLPHAEDMETKKDVVTATTDDEDRPVTSDSTFLATSIDGAIRVWDRRQATPVARIVPRNTPPWCLSACWSLDGNNIYAGRRNNTVEEYDLRKGLKGPERVFRFPNGSGAVTSVKAMPNGRHLICASYDILRLYDLKQPESTRSTVPFLIVPGHRTGVVSHLYMDPACRFLMSTGGNRGWEGASTEVLLGYEINVSNQ